MKHDWISVTEAVILTGKSERTMRMFVNKHDSDASYIKRQGRNVLLNKEKVVNNFGMKFDQRFADTQEKEAKHKKEAMQLATSAKSIEALTIQLQTKDKTIEELLRNKQKAPFYLSVFFDHHLNHEK